MSTVTRKSFIRVCEPVGFDPVILLPYSQTKGTFVTYVRKEAYLVPVAIFFRIHTEVGFFVLRLISEFDTAILSLCKSHLISF